MKKFYNLGARSAMVLCNFQYQLTSLDNSMPRARFARSKREMGMGWTLFLNLIYLIYSIFCHLLSFALGDGSTETDIMYQKSC